MGTLQQALASIQTAPAPSKPKSPPKPHKPGQQRVHRVLVGTNDTPRIAIYGEFDRPSKSEAPPEREGNFAERFFEEKVPCKS